MKILKFFYSRIVLVLVVLVLLIGAPVIVGRAMAVDSERAYFQVPQSNVATGEEFFVAVDIDSDVSINAINLQISYSSERALFLDSDTNNSIVSFWQSGSVLLSKGHIRLSGGMIPSFNGSGGLVANLHFRAVSSGDFKLTLENGSGYLANGSGTQVSFVGEPKTFTIISKVSKIETPTVPSVLVNELKIIDNTPPTLMLRLIKDPISGNNIVVYQAGDQESGIRRVEMRSEVWFTWGPWQEIGNPAQYPAGACNVQVRAVNKNGDITTKEISSSSIPIKMLVVILIIFVFIIIFVMYNKKRHMPKI